MLAYTLPAARALLGKRERLEPEGLCALHLLGPRPRRATRGPSWALRASRVVFSGKRDTVSLQGRFLSRSACQAEVRERAAPWKRSSAPFTQQGHHASDAGTPRGPPRGPPGAPRGAAGALRGLRGPYSDYPTSASVSLPEETPAPLLHRAWWPAEGPTNGQGARASRKSHTGRSWPRPRGSSGR